MFLFGHPFSVQRCTGLCPGVLFLQFHSHPELAASLPPPQDLLSRFVGERCWLKGTLPPQPDVAFCQDEGVQGHLWGQEYKFGMGRLSYILQTKPH